MHALSLAAARTGLSVVFLTVALPAAATDREAVIAATYSGFSLLPPSTTRMVVCHGFGCKNRTVLAITANDRGHLSALLASGRASAAAERAAVARAGAWLDRRMGRAAGTTGHVARAGMSYVTKTDGQLDCIDTSRNTTSLLLLLDRLKLLRHHAVEQPAARGFIIDGKAPHATAVLRERKTGRRWAVDAWTRAYGQRPEIMPLARWFDSD